MKIDVENMILCAEKSWISIAILALFMVLTLIGEAYSNKALVIGSAILAFFASLYNLYSSFKEVQKLKQKIDSIDEAFEITRNSEEEVANITIDSGEY